MSTVGYQKIENPTTRKSRLLFVGSFRAEAALQSQSRKDLPDWFQRDGYEVVRVSSRAGKVARLADIVTTAIRQRAEYDLAHIDIFSGPAFVWAQAASFTLRAMGKPYVLTLHGGQLPEFASRHPRRVGRLLRKARAVTCPSDFLAEGMRRFSGVIRVIPNPLDLERFHYQERIAAQPRLIWVRAFHKIYQPWIAVEVLGNLVAAHPDATLVMIGPDKGDGSLEKTRDTVARLGLEGQVTIKGPIPNSEVPAELQVADIFLNTTTVDNAPRSVVEAQACGLCVVSTNVGGVPDVVSDRINGLLVEPSDAPAMAKAAQELLEDPSLASKLSRNGSESARAHDWSNVLPMWEGLFREIL